MLGMGNQIINFIYFGLYKEINRPEVVFMSEIGINIGAQLDFIDITATTN